MKNNDFKRNIRKYLKDISDHLPKNYPNRKALLHTLRQNIGQYAAEHPSAGWDDIVKHFGTSRELAASYMAQLSDTELAASSQARRRNIHFSTAACCAAFVLLIIGIYNYSLWKQTHDFIITETLCVYGGTEMPSEWPSELDSEYDDSQSEYQESQAEIPNEDEE